MWQFAEACRGLKDACLELGIPVTGGNVSLYNQTGETAILPTPGRRRARRHRRRHPAHADRLRRPRASAVFLLGETREELSGSEWAHVVHGHLGGLPPRGRPRRRAGAGRAAASRRVGPAHLAPTTSPTAAWPRRWSSPRCATASAPRSTLDGRPVRRRCSPSRPPVRWSRSRTTAGGVRGGGASYGVPVAAIGTTGGDALAVDGAFSIPPRRAARRLDGDAAYRPGLSTSASSSSCQSNAARDRSARPSGSPGSSSSTRRTSSAGRSAWT